MANQAATQAKERPQPTHETPTDLSREGVAEITAALRQLLADSFALYLKTKNFHWHVRTPFPRLSPAPRRTRRPDLRDD